MLWFVFGSLTLSLFLGCGSSENNVEMHPVSGTVNVDGAPLAEGIIIFEDVEKGLTGSCTIKDGAYSGKVPAGDLKAKIVKIEKTGKDPMGVSEGVKETVLKSGISVNIKTGGAKLEAFEVP
jgi:hypothetical protein